MNLKWTYQKLTRGFSEKDLYNLDCTIAEFILPRLRAYRERTKEHGGHPCNLPDVETWLVILYKMEVAFDLMLQDLEDTILTNDQHKQIEEGMDYFTDYFRSLWI